ncbi:MAG: Crp/Fnr family transcriptional regulator [Elusimicrobiota bacterium]
MIKPSLPRWFRFFFRDEKHRQEVLFLRSIPLFHGFSSRELSRLIVAFQKRNYAVGEVVFSEGQSGKAVFLLKSGAVELHRKTTDGNKQVLAIAQPGQMFGEMALLEQVPRSATATVIKNGEIYFLYTSAMEDLIHRYPTLGIKLLKNIAAFLSSLIRRANLDLEQKTKGLV